ncbi:Uncharacterised protein [Cedecea lapagei]|uniref:Uncharacterized protein n=1 Tax=Cedecea lapagei TaxID=158823 RepID=A0A3S4JZV1_9ENTR|nr:Uncharacterised protein [Cedecea lapagei]
MPYRIGKHFSCYKEGKTGGNVHYPGSAGKGFAIICYIYLWQDNTPSGELLFSVKFYQFIY